jgi:hypothetical protein
VTPDLAQLAGGPLVAAPVSVSSPFDGLWLVQDGMSLAHGIENGDWVEGGMAAFSLLMDGAAALIDPIGTLIGMGLSWVLEHIWPLNEYLNALTGNAGEVLRMSQTWANISTHLSGAGADLDRFLGDLESLEGAAIEAYRKFQSDVAEHIALAGNLAAATSAALELASTIVKIVHDLTRDVISQIAGTAISAAITTAATVGFGAPVAIAQVAARVSALVPKVTRAITSVIRSFEKLAPLLAKVDEIFEALKRVLNRILRGGDTPTTPHPGGDTPTTPHTGDGPPGGGGMPPPRVPDDLPTTVPDGTHTAIHSGSDTPEALDAIFRDQYPELLEVNAPRYEAGTAGFDHNCTRCVVATDYTLDGAPASAMPTDIGWANDVTDALGGEWTPANSYDDIVARMETLGEGSRGVVLLQRGPGIEGHVFNVVFDRNGVVFLDGQIGGFATLEMPYEALYFLETAGGAP